MISLVRRRRPQQSPGSAPQAAPSIRAADDHGDDQNRLSTGPASSNPIPAAPMAPKYSWPSAPMLNRRIRNATAAARPVKASGVEAMSVFVSAPFSR